MTLISKAILNIEPIINLHHLLPNSTERNKENHIEFSCPKNQIIFSLINLKFKRKMKRIIQELRTLKYRKDKGR